MILFLFKVSVRLLFFFSINMQLLLYFLYIYFQLRSFDDHYVLRHLDVPHRSKRSADYHTLNLSGDPRVSLTFSERLYKMLTHFPITKPTLSLHEVFIGLSNGICTISELIPNIYISLMKFIYEIFYENNPENLDPSYKTDLDFRDCLEGKIAPLVTEEIG